MPTRDEDVLSTVTSTDFFSSPIIILPFVKPIELLDEYKSE